MVLTGIALALYAPLALWKMRADYWRFGRLTVLGSASQELLYFAHGVFMILSAWQGYEPPRVETSASSAVGAALMLLGLVFCVRAMIAFRSAAKLAGLDTGTLSTTGLYAWSRNPQMIGYGVLLFGLALIWWSNTAWIGLVAYVLLMYLIVRIEEEHLERVFGDAYRNYRARVPRFLGWGRR
jgi:protein-S-isoprenylcysteine O-methyltransferase Ste14